jgi:hypothetical protein
MEDIGVISNGERADSVRVKLNKAIERINQSGQLSILLTEVSEALSRADAMLIASEQELLLLRSLSATIQQQGYLSANAMELYYPSSISIRSHTVFRILSRLYPVYALQNVLYLPAGGDSLEVTPDGVIHVRSLGTTKIHVIPPGRTSLYRTISIEVRYPYLRRSGDSLRLVQSGLRIL